MIDKMKSTIIKHHMISSGDTIVVGFSGGPDSMALLHGLMEIKEAFNLNLIAVHVNHMLRGAYADADEAFAMEHCTSIGVPLKSFKVDVSKVALEKGCSFEEAGRSVRYEKFMEVAAAYDQPKIAVGQNRNDVVETAFINLFRGAGIEGLSSIEYKREPYIIRPLMDVNRTEIEAYCNNKGLIPRRDHTNDETEYTRNRIRNELIPYLKENINPSIEEGIARTVEIMKEERSFWDSYCQRLYEQICIEEREGIRLKGASYSNMHIAEKKHMIRWIIKKLKGNLTDVSAELINQVVSLNRTGTFVRIDGSHQVFLEYGDLLFEKIASDSNCKPPVIKVRQFERTLSHGLSPNRWQVALDGDTISGKLHIRHRQPGDRFHPLGMEGTKKVKDYFIDEKIPPRKRDTVWLVCDDEKIVWIHGYRIDNRCKITNDTKNILLIALEDVVETE